MYVSYAQAEGANSAEQTGHDELTEVMKLAERLQASVENLSLRRTAAIFLALGVGILGALIFYVLFGVGPFRLQFPQFAVLPSVVVIFGFITGTVMAILGERLRVQLKRDKRALDQVVSLLQEMQSVYMQAEQWSPLKQALFRIQMARFDVVRSESSPTSLTIQSTYSLSDVNLGKTIQQQLDDVVPASDDRVLDENEFLENMKRLDGKFGQLKSYIQSLNGRSLEWLVKVRYVSFMDNPRLVCALTSQPNSIVPVDVIFEDLSQADKEKLELIERDNDVIVKGIFRSDAIGLYQIDGISFKLVA